MGIYYIICGVLLFFSIVELILKEKSIFLFYLSIFFIILFVGLRYNVGNDYIAYYNNYIAILSEGYYITNEPLYILVNLILPNFYWVIFFFSITSFYFLLKSILYFNKSFPITSLLIYFFLFLIIYNIHLIRQGLSIALILWGYKFLYKEKKIAFILIAIVSSLFHLSALFVIPFAFIINKNISVKLQLIIFIIALTIALNAEALVGLYYDIVSNIPLLNKYTQFYREAEVVSYDFTLGMLMDIGLFFLFLFKYKHLKEKDLFLYKIFYISVILSLVLMIEPTSLRMNYYFRTVLIFMIPLLYKYYFKTKLLIFISISILSFGYLYQTFNSLSEYGRTDRNLKYKTILDK